MEGLERVAPLKTLEHKGIRFHIEGSGPRNPLRKLYMAVIRLDDDGRVIVPEESLSREATFLGLIRWGNGLSRPRMLWGLSRKAIWRT